MEFGISFFFGISFSKYGGLAQLARAPALHAGGHRFDSDILHQEVTTPRRGILHCSVNGRTVYGMRFLLPTEDGILLTDKRFIDILGQGIYI